MDNTAGLFDEELPGQGQRPLVALLHDAEVVHVLACPAVLNTAVVLGVIERGDLANHVSILLFE